MQTSAIAVLLFVTRTVSIEAAVIRGTVVEKLTGYSLSRALVILQPVPSAGQAPRNVRTGDTGEFEFAGLAGGAYLVKASRRGFMPMEYGQKRWNSAGTAILLDKDATLSMRLPLARFGSIAGTVRDANEVGIPDQDVAAYAATQPPRYVARAKSDDRGVFRIPGLEPGTYLIRTTGDRDDDIDYLPTFSRQTLRVEEARVVIVYPDEDARDGDVRPIPGRLFEISGSTPNQPGFAITVTLASDMGRFTVPGPAFHFGVLPPGRYEIYAEAREHPPGARLMGGYSEILLDRNLTSLALPLNEVRESQIVLEGAGPAVSAAAFVRRKDFAGVGPAQSLKLTASTRVTLFPGRWEFLTTPPDGYYVARFSPLRNMGRPEGWNDIQVNNFSRFTITLSNGPAAIHGTVKNSGAPAGGAPVFLETWDPAARRRLLDLRETRTDMKGNYRFDGLPPGDYRVLSTFEYTAPDPGFLDAAQAKALRIESAGDSQADLDLYGLQ